jgi:predicted permease
MYVAIGMGYIANCFKILTRDGYEGVHTFVVVLCIPCIIFRVLAGANL